MEKPCLVYELAFTVTGTDDDGAVATDTFVLASPHLKHPLYVIDRADEEDVAWHEKLLEDFKDFLQDHFDGEVALHSTVEVCDTEPDNLSGECVLEKSSESISPVEAPALSDD